jgi:hypothetical protein
LFVTGFLQVEGELGSVILDDSFAAKLARSKGRQMLDSPSTQHANLDMPHDDGFAACHSQAALRPPESTQGAILPVSFSGVAEEKMVENDTAVEQVGPLHSRAASKPVPELDTLMEAIAGPEEAIIGTVGQQQQIEALRESMRAMHNDMRAMHDETRAFRAHFDTMHDENRAFRAHFDTMHDENRAFRTHFDMFMSAMANMGGRLAAIERAVQLRPQVQQTHSAD